MKPTVYDIPYYEGDTFTVVVYVKDSAKNIIPLGEIGANHAYFRLANRRGDNPEWHAVGGANITQLVTGGDWCIVCNLDGETGKSIDNGYVYDIGYHMGSPPLDRTTVVTGTFSVMSEVKESDGVD